MDINNPEPGTYARRFGRGTPLCAVLIEDRTERDEDGSPLEDEKFVALVDGREMPVDKVWPCQPIDREEYERILHANRLAIGGNNPPLALLDEAADIVASYAFLSTPAEKIDQVKKINTLLKELPAESSLATEPLHVQMDEMLAPYVSAELGLIKAKEALLADIHTARKPGETIRGRYASAFGRKVQKVVVENIQMLPDFFWARTPDVKKIEAALKAGQVVPGCRLDTTEATTVS